MKRTAQRTFLATVALVLLSATTYALFTNGGFESGTLSSWTETTLLNPGLVGGQPFSGASIVRNAGGSDGTTAVGPAATPMTLTDPLVPSVQYPRFGQYAGRVNFNLSSQNANAMTQQATVGAGDVDASDGQVHVRFSFVPVLESPGHAPHEQPYFYIALRNLTKSSTIWQRFTFANEAGIPWQTQNGFVYTPWQLVDVTGDASVIAVGDVVALEVLAAGCSLGGHRGHVYVDSFGATIPGGTIVASAPSSTIPNATLTYSFHVANGGTSALTSPVVSIAVPSQTVFQSVSDGACSHSSGTVTCNVADLAAGASLDFTMNVTVNAGATGTITLGNYSISGTGYPALLGPSVQTIVNGPVAVADSYTTPEDTALTVAAPGVLGNDTDPNGDALTAVLVSGPAHGTLTLNGNGSFTYTPAANYGGPDSFIYRARDPGNNSSPNTNVTLSVTAVNDAPVATADAYGVTEDTPLTVNAAAGVLANDVDVDGPSIAAAVVAGPSNGTLTLNTDGSVSYTPNANYAGPDSFTYLASDGSLPSAVTTVSLTVNAVNDAPTATPDAYSTSEDSPLTVNAAAGVFANDTDVDGPALSPVLVSGPTNGSLTLNGNGSFTYTPNSNYFGPDSFVYRASDGTLQSADTTVTLTVNGANDAPTGNADSYTTNEDTPLSVPAAGVLANDTDIDPSTTLSALLVAGPANGTLALASDGSFLYTPNLDYNGPDSFTYRAGDDTTQSAITTVTLGVTAVNDAPTATGDSYSTAEDTPLTVPTAGVLANDADVDTGTTLSAVLRTGPTHGTLTVNPNGGFVYTPDSNYNGPDSFVYRASDGSLQSADTTVTLTVTAVNDPPTGSTDGSGGSYTTTEDGSLTVAAPGVLGNDTDPDTLATLTAVLVTPPAHGTLTLNPDGSFIYTPEANYNGPDSFVYRASDGTAQSADTTVVLNVTPLPDPPTASNDGSGGTFTATEDGSLTVPAPGVLGNDSDPDGDPLTATVVTGPAHGTLALNPDGSFTYTPEANYTGPDSFTYVVSDGTSTSTPASVTLNVAPVDDPPTATPNTYSAREDRTLSVPASAGLLVNDTDIDTGTGALTAILVTGPAHGTLTLNADGSFTYVPDANFNGTDTFTYAVSDGTTTSSPVTVTLNVSDDALLTPSAGRDIGGTRVVIAGEGFGPAGTPVTVTIDGVPALEAEVLDDGHITFVTPALPPGTPVDVVFAVNGGAPETLPGAYLPLPVPAAGSPIDTDGDGITDEIELKYGLDPTDPADADDDPDQDGVPSNTEIVTGTHPTAPYLRYFAEGINNTVFNTGIAVANASTATMEVQITFFRQGQAPVRKNLTLAGKTRTILNTATVAGMENAAFGVEVAGNEAVSADRTTFWDLGGREAHGEHAVEASPTWYFAEGATTGRFSLFYLLTNPNSQPANATVTFLRQAGAPITKQVVVPGYARLTIPVNTTDPGLATAELGGVVTADRPIVAERSMYLSSPTTVWEAGTGGTGVTSPASKWFFGEGATGDFFDAWILLSNPGSTDATVDVRYVADNGADVTRSHLVPAGRRITIRVVDEDAAMKNTSFATFVTSTNAVPVVAERAMWWRSNEGRWTAGHVGVGFTQGGRKWVTADGVAAADGGSDTYALVTNTESRSGLLKVTAVFGDGTAPIERLFPIGANQRFTLRGRQRFPEVVGKGYSFIIESIGASPVDIVVDHSTYFNMDGRFWAMGTTSPGSKIK